MPARKRDPNDVIQDVAYQRAVAEELDRARARIRDEQGSREWAYDIASSRYVVLSDQHRGAAWGHLLLATPGLLALAEMEEELSTLLGGRRIDLRTSADLSRYFRDEVVRTAEVQYSRG
jgi:hypothetical protein